VKVSAFVVAVLLLTLAVSFGLVRMDVLDAATLRYLPEVFAIIIAGAVAIAAIRGGTKRSKARSKK
jgi:hypothetical protein